MEQNQIAKGLFADLGVRHQAVLQAALHSFCVKGYFNTSIQDIVADSNVSVGFIYHHFGDKAGLARALFDHFLGRMNELLDQIEARYANAQERCRAVIEMLFDLTEAEPEAMEFIIHARHREFLPTVKSICSTSAFIRMRRFVALGIESGELQPMDAVLAASLAYGAAIRMICLRLDGVIEQPITAYLPELWRRNWTLLENPSCSSMPA